MRADIVPGAVFPDSTSAEQRAAWAKGDKTSFYPYGKTQAQVLSEQD